MADILLIDDEAPIRHAFQKAFRDADLRVRTATTAAEGIKEFIASRPDIVLLDFHLPDSKGLQLFEELKEVDSRVPVILITGHGTSELAIEAMKLGVYEYLLKPLELAELRRIVRQAIETSRLMRTPTLLGNEGASTSEGDILHGRCSAMQEVYKSIGRVACQNVTVLILGESGTGKELVARAIYQHSQRNQRPFLAINCAAIPEDLLESELFGNEKGAFTGADKQRIGKFEQCDGGTIFLDEIGDMPLSTQAKMLRLLQDQTFQRVGGSEVVKTDVRIIAATNANLEKMVQAGKFRRDLFYRLNVFTIPLPPLRERGDDVATLIEYYRNKIGKELGKGNVQVTDEAYERLKTYRWPGNVRELQSVLKQAILKMNGSVLLPDFLPSHVGADGENVLPELGHDGAFSWEKFVTDRLVEGSENLHQESIDLIEKYVITRVLNHVEGNRVKAAKILGITRTSLRNKLRYLGIQVEKTVWAEDGQDEQ
jgi:two-component system, NtrC family, response regulator AtoC